MSVEERLADRLAVDGYVHTTYRELGLPFDTKLALAVSAAAEKGVFSKDAAELTEHIAKQAMTMVQEANALTLGTQLVAPVVAKLFPDNPRVQATSRLYALNRYETGGYLGHHQDSVGSTVLVVTVSGTREFRVLALEAAPSDSGEVTFLLEPGSVMLLDGQVDPRHAVLCVQGPSVSAIYDVPDLLRR